jgi:ABC-2 type transport system ATP-binding protein
VNAWPPPAPPTTPLIELQHVSKWFGDVVAVSDVTFGIGTGITALLGPNGAGKSTVLRLLCGLARPSQGTVSVLGGNPRQDVSIFGRIGLVPQQEALFEALTAREFVETAARLLRVSDPRAATEWALGQVEVSTTDTRPVKALS